MENYNIHYLYNLSYVIASKSKVHVIHVKNIHISGIQKYNIQIGIQPTVQVITPSNDTASNSTLRNRKT